MQGSQKPCEIVICLPEGVRFDSNYDEVITVHSKERGQVIQRLKALGLASGQYILQLDDDVFVGRETVRELIIAVNQDLDMVCGPVWLNKSSKKSLNPYPLGILGFFKSVYYALLLGTAFGTRRMGKVSGSGIPFGVDHRFLEHEFFFTDWLPGGCVLYRRDNAITDNIFPFSGKAYLEDLFFSYARSKSGLKHYVVKKAIAYTIQENEVSRQHSFESSELAFKAFQCLREKSMLRLRLHYTVWRLLKRISLFRPSR